MRSESSRDCTRGRLVGLYGVLGLRGLAGLACFAVSQVVALAVHLEDVDVVGGPVEQGPGQSPRAEEVGPLIEREGAGHQSSAAFVALAEDFEELFGGGLGERHEAKFLDDQQLVCQSASKIDPRSASNFDPLKRRVLARVLAASEAG